MSLIPALDRFAIAESKKQQRESIWPSADVDTKEIMRQLMLSNAWPEVVTYDGPTCNCTAEAEGGPESACALISMYCARTILDLEKQVRAREYRSEGRSKEDEAAWLLGDILAERTVQRIVSIGKHLKGAVRMGPSELLDVPLFEQVFTPNNRIERFSSYENIMGMLDQLSSDGSRRIAATIITQASLSAVCVRMGLLEEELYIVFDPHPRMDHPNGPGFMLSTSKTTTASFLNCLLDSSVVFNVSGTDLFQPLQSQYFTAHLLDAKDSYHRIMAYQNEQMLRDSFLCTHEESLSSSVDYVNLWNQLIQPADIFNASAGPSSPSRLRAESSSSTDSSLSSKSSSIGDSLPPLPQLHNSSRLASVSESWRPETAFGHYLLEHIKLISHKPATTPDRDLPPPIKVTFDCAVCLETYPVYSSVQLSGCDHRFCKECMRGHIRSFLENARYPIQCPVCLLDRGIPDPGNVTEAVLIRLQLPQTSIDKFRDLKTLQHSVRLECPSCQLSYLLFRKDYLQTKILTCPSGTCNHKWCKSCFKAIFPPSSSFSSSSSSSRSYFAKAIGSTKAKGNRAVGVSSNAASDTVKHSCKGDGFESLMKKKGWRYCPGCTMPVIKESGCNHMSCVAPGCHTHFCYKCGKLIVVSATGRNVGEEVTLHYGNGGCRQFERKLNCTIQ